MKSGSSVGDRYSWHTKIVATTFWVGDIFDPNAPNGSNGSNEANGSRMMSAYDDDWLDTYGGCDGRWIDGRCITERRLPDNEWFPRSMVPLQNPFYVGLPYDDINDDRAFAERSEYVPWASDEPYASNVDDRGFSFMKDRWVEIRRSGRVCFGQVEDAGPGRFDDVAYVFSRVDTRPANRQQGHAGIEVSPAINGCLDFAELDGQGELVDWRFVDHDHVPAGPWRRIVTTSHR